MTLNDMASKIAHLPKRDRRWLLKRLNKTVPTLAKQLAENRFPLPVEPKSIQPDWVERLKSEPALLIATVLSQEDYPWQEAFLESIENRPAIEKAMQKLPKPAACQLLAQYWFAQAKDSFSHLLEMKDG